MPERRALVLEADSPDGPLFAVVDPSARFVTPAVGSMRFAALLTPNSSVDAAREALAAAGGAVRS